MYQDDFLELKFFDDTGSIPCPNQLTELYLGGTIGVQWAVDSAIDTGFYKLLSVLVKIYPPHILYANIRQSQKQQLNSAY